MKSKLRPVCLALSAAVVISSFPLEAFAASEYEVTEGSFTFMPAFEAQPARDTYYYSDSYFTEGSDTDNIHRRTMSMALALSTIEIGGSSYVSDLLTDIGFEDIAIGDMNDTPSSDTIGTAIAHKKVDGRELVAVAVRGSKYDREWEANITAGLSGDIEGFSEPSKKVIQRLKDYIKDNGLENVKIWITGYSRGGTVADLMGVYINQHPDEFSTGKDDVFIYTFEAPAASTDSTVYSNIHETRNKNDIINYVYPEKWGLHSNGNAEWIGEDKTIPRKAITIMGDSMISEFGEINKEEFIKDFMEFLSKELPREKYSGDFDKSISDLIDLFFSKTPEERAALSKAFSDTFSGNKTPAVQTIGDEGGSGSVLDIFPDDMRTAIYYDVFLMMLYSSDKTYDKIEGDVNRIVLYLADYIRSNGKDVPLTDGESAMIANAAGKIIRGLGPVAGKDYHYKDGKGYESSVPASFSDPDYDPTADLSPDTPEEDTRTDAEKGTDAGKDNGQSDGYCDGLDMDDGVPKYANFNDTPDDGETHSQDYLDAYKAAYPDAYEEGYAEGLEDGKPLPDDERGMSDGSDHGYNDAAEDSTGGKGYKASYNDKAPETDENGKETSEEYRQAYSKAYAETYESTYADLIEKVLHPDMPIYHFATLLGNFEDIWTEHKPQYNWELVKSLDSYYGSEAPTDSSQPDSSSLPEESKPEESSLPDSSSSSSSSNSSKGSVTPSSDSNPATGARGAAIATILLLAAGSITVSKKRR